MWSCSAGCDGGGGGEGTVVAPVIDGGGSGGDADAFEATDSSVVVVVVVRCIDSLTLSTHCVPHLTNLTLFAPDGGTRVVCFIIMYLLTNQTPLYFRSQSPVRVLSLMTSGGIGGRNREKWKLSRWRERRRRHFALPSGYDGRAMATTRLTSRRRRRRRRQSTCWILSGRTDGRRRGRTNGRL